MNNLFPVNVRKINNVTYASDNYSLSTEQSIMAKTIQVPATGVCTTTVATITFSNQGIPHGYVVGDTVVLTGTGVFDGSVVVTSANDYAFTYTVSTTAVTTPVNCTVAVTTIEVNEYIGTQAPIVYTVTQSLAALQLAAPVGSCIPVTIVGEGASASLLAPAATGAYSALLFTGKTVNIRQYTGSTLTFGDMDRSSSTVTVTCAAGHGLQVGQYVTIDSSNNALDGTYAVATVTSPTVFTYTTTTSGTVTNATGTGYFECTKVFQYKEGARNILYFANEYYASLTPYTTDTFQKTTSSLTTAAGTGATTTIANPVALVGQKVTGLSLYAYSGTLNTNGIPVVTGGYVSSAGTITLDIANIHGTNALSGTLTVNYTLSN